jgi:drug/metabolite transporter (DMT)-like permease
MKIPKLEGNSGGALILVFGLFLFSIQDVIIKYFSGYYSVLEIVFIRCAIASMLVFLVMLMLPGKQAYIANRPGFMLVRGLLGFLSYLGYYMAIAAMPLAEVVSITFTMPLFVTALSALILGENVGFRRWAAVCVGFMGVLLIISPDGDFNLLAVSLAFMASITYATHTIITRVLSKNNNPLTMSFNTLAIFTIVSGILSLLVYSEIINIESTHPSMAFLGRDWIYPSETDWIYLIVIAFIAAIGFYCLTKAYCLAEASAISPFEFSYILWAVVYGIVFWNEIPEVTTHIGIAVLISSNIYISYRERLNQRKITTATTTAEYCHYQPKALTEAP